MQSQPKENILLVDDHPENLVALESVLADLGQNLVCASSGRDALKALLREDFAVILLDVQMPEMDGFETATLIRARSRSQHTPIIFLTAINKTETHVHRGYSVGAVDYVFKPFQPEVLRAKVAAFVDLARKTRELQDEIERRTRAESEVRRLNQGLEQRVAERTAALEAANRDLQVEIQERRRAEAERGRLLALEQAARVAAEEARGRLEFLGQASAVLAGSLEYHTTLECVARLAVPYLADFCIVDLVGDDGQIRRLAGNHVSPEQMPLIREMQERFAPDWSSPQSAARVLRSGHPEVVPDVTPEWLRCISRCEDHYRLWQLLAPTSVMVLPLVARGAALGVLTLAYSVSGRRYEDGDPALGRDLAGRAAAALDNARLFFEVEEAGRRKDEFLAMLAHELRNPLAAISNAGYALEALQPEDTRRLARLRSVITRQTQHLTRLVDDLLDISRITRGKIELRKELVLLGDVIRSAVETNDPFLKARKHTLHVSLPNTPVWLEADPTRLEQVIGNLLNNSAKYTEPGGQVWLTADCEQRDRNSFVRIRVRDNGMGISADLLPRIFDLFTQAERSSDRSQGGLGIGLALVRNLVQMHGGWIEAGSPGPGLGSEFVVHLPCVPTPPDAEQRGVRKPRARPTPTATARKRVMLVEDNRDAAETLTEMLRLWGHEVRAVESGVGALDLAPAYHPDVVLMDIGLPEMDGYEVARRLRQEGAGRQAFLIALTGYGMEESRRLSQEAGFDLHLTKPVDPTELRELLAGAATTRPG